MSRYKAVYKCPLCGALISNGKIQDVNYNDLPKLLGKVILNQEFVKNPYLYEAPMYILCNCSNGNAGLAAFAGFMQVK